LNAGDRATVAVEAHVRFVAGSTSPQNGNVSASAVAASTNDKAHEKACFVVIRLPPSEEFYRKYSIFKLIVVNCPSAAGTADALKPDPSPMGPLDRF
jgi:hypothetical protein